MNNVTKVYREIGDGNPDLIQWLDLRDQLWNIPDNEGQERLFIDNDVPRDGNITPVIVEQTVGFALFDNEGDLVATYPDLQTAIKAQDNAKIVVSTEVEFDGDAES